MEPKYLPLEKIETKYAPLPVGPYSQAIKAGNHIYVSGVLPVHTETGKIIEGGIIDQTHQVFDNIEAILGAEDVGVDQIVSADVLMIDNRDMAEMNAVYEGRVSSKTPPVRKTYGVSWLPLPGALIEIGCVAYIERVTDS